jgi:hypothetical protein
MSGPESWWESSLRHVNERKICLTEWSLFEGKPDGNSTALVQDCIGILNLYSDLSEVVSHPPSLHASIHDAFVQMPYDGSHPLA